MKVRLKDCNAWAQGELTYVKGQSYDVDKRYAEEVLLASGKFEEVKAEKKDAETKKKEEIK